MIEAHFENIRNLIKGNIKEARSDIKIAVAWFTQRELFAEILEALNRGVDVSMIIIKDFINCGLYGLPLQQFVDAGGHLHFVTDRSWTMHNKFCLFDGNLVVTGSYNWTYSAETRNAENVILTDDSSVCQDYNDYFDRLWDGSLEESHVPKIEISSEDVIKDFSMIYDEIDALVQNKTITNEALEVLKKAKAKADANARIATTQKPLLQATTTTTVVVPDNNERQISNTFDQINPIIASAKPRKAVILKSLYLPLYNEQHKLIVKRGERLPVIDRNISVRNAVIYENGTTTFGIEKQQFDEFGDAYYEMFDLLQFKGLTNIPPGRIKYDVNVRISTTGKLKMAIYCYYNGRWKYGSIQLIEGEDYIVGK